MASTRNTTVLEGAAFKAGEFAPTAIKARAGRKSAYLNHARHRNVKVRTPPMRLAFPTKVQQFNDGMPKATVTVSFDHTEEGDADFNPEVAYYLKQVQAVEDCICAHAAHKDSTNYLGRDISGQDETARLEKARGLQNRGLREGRMNERTGKPWAPTLRFKLYLTADGLPDVVACVKHPGKAREAVQPEDVIPLLVTGAHVRVTYRHGPIWFKRSGRLNQYGLPRIAEAIEIFPFRRDVVETPDFDAAALSFGPNALSSYGSPTVRVGYGPKKGRLLLRSPWTPIMGNSDGEGIECFPNSSKDYFRLRFVDHSGGGDATAFCELLEAIEERLRALASNRALAWFNQAKKVSDMDDHFTPILRRIGDTNGTADPASAPFIKIKLPRKRFDDETAGYRAKFVDRDGAPVSDEDVSAIVRRDVRARVIIQTCPIYIMNQGPAGTFGMPFEAVEVELDTTVAEMKSGGGGGGGGGSRAAQNADDLFGLDTDVLSPASAGTTQSTMSNEEEAAATGFVSDDAADMM